MEIKGGNGYFIKGIREISIIKYLVQNMKESERGETLITKYIWFTRVDEIF